MGVMDKMLKAMALNVEDDETETDEEIREEDDEIVTSENRGGFFSRWKEDRSRQADEEPAEDEEEDYVPPRRERARAERAERAAERTERSETRAEREPAPAKPTRKLFAERRESAAAEETPRRKSQVSMVIARSAEDSEQIVDLLINGRSGVMNLEAVGLADAQRIIDFVGGACYTIGGSLQGISSKIFIAAPGSVDLSGDFIEMVNDTLNMNTLNLSSY